AGSPQWAALAAIGDQLAGHRLGDINPALYSIANSSSKYRSAFHDITIGNNDVAEIGGGFDTARGWDPVTGLGSPDAAKLLPLLVPRARRTRRTGGRCWSTGRTDARRSRSRQGRPPLGRWPSRAPIAAPIDSGPCAASWGTSGTSRLTHLASRARRPLRT